MIEENSKMPNPIRYELIDKDGRVRFQAISAEHCANVAHQLWPDQHKDEERRGLGWDVQIAGAK